MEAIELEQGWLVRQMEEVRREVASWPDAVKPLRTINASLVQQPSVAENCKLHTDSSDADLAPPSE